MDNTELNESNSNDNVQTIKADDIIDDDNKISNNDEKNNNLDINSSKNEKGLKNDNLEDFKLAKILLESTQINTRKG